MLSRVVEEAVSKEEWEMHGSRRVVEEAVDPQKTPIALGHVTWHGSTRQGRSVKARPRGSGSIKSSKWVGDGVKARRSPL